MLASVICKWNAWKIQHMKCLIWFFRSQTSNSYGRVEMVSSPNHTISWESLANRLTSSLCTYDNNPSLISGRRRMTVACGCGWDQAGIELATPESAVRCVTYCANGPNHMFWVSVNLTMLNPDMSWSESSEDPDQLASQKPADQNPHCLWLGLIIHANNWNRR